MNARIHRCIHRLIHRRLQVIHSLLSIAFTILLHDPQQAGKLDWPQWRADERMTSSWKRRFLFHSAFLSLIYLASRKERITVCWALCYCRGEKIKTLALYLKISQAVLAICQLTSCPCNCPRGKHSSFLDLDSTHISSEKAPPFPWQFTAAWL